MNLAEDRSKRPWTYADYLAIDSDERYEVEGGTLICLASPSTQHQETSIQLILRLGGFFKGGRCKVYHDLDTRLFPEEDGEKNFTYQPDISVVCNPEQLDEHGCNGAPTLVAEILSPSTAGRDCIDKLNAYKKAGVKEYWIVDPMSLTVRICMLQEENADAIVLEKNDTLQSITFPGLEIALEDIFPAE